MSTSIPASVEDLKNYVLASLGSDVVNVELSEEQQKIVIENALQMFFDRVYDAVDRIYMAVSLPVSSGTASSCIINVPESVMSVERLYGTSRPSEFRLFTYIYEPSNLMFNREYSFSFSRYSRSITVNETVDVSTEAVAFVHKKLNISTYTDIYNHPWLKKYAVALATEQWGKNLTKYTNVPLPGNMQLNGDGILSTGRDLVREAIEELDSRWGFYPLPVVS